MPRTVRTPLAVLAALLVAANLLGPVSRFEAVAAPICHAAAPAGSPNDGHPAPWTKHCCFAASLALSPPTFLGSVAPPPCADGVRPVPVAAPSRPAASRATRIRAPPV